MRTVAGEKYVPLKSVCLGRMSFLAADKGTAKIHKDDLAHDEMCMQLSFGHKHLQNSTFTNLHILKEREKILQ